VKIESSKCTFKLKYIYKLFAKYEKFNLTTFPYKWYSNSKQIRNIFCNDNHILNNKIKLVSLNTYLTQFLIYFY